MDSTSSQEVNPIIKCGNKGERERDQWAVLTAVEKGGRKREKREGMRGLCQIVHKGEKEGESGWEEKRDKDWASGGKGKEGGEVVGGLGGDERKKVGK